MTRQIWLCLRCGWRRRAVSDDWEIFDQHSKRCDGFACRLRYLDARGRITGGPRSRP